jgi:hypothetical protein
LLRCPEIRGRPRDKCASQQAVALAESLLNQSAIDEEVPVRTLSMIFATLLGTAPAFAQVRVEVTAPPPPSITISAPPPPRVVVAPPPRVVVAPPPPVRVNPTARVVVAPPPPARVVVAAPPPPTVTFAAPPPLVVVEPGVQVVQDADEEVFFVDGWYWHPGANGVWFRTRSYRGGWAAAPPRVVPAALVRIPPGQYRHYRGEGRGEGHEGWKQERHEEKRMEREERHEEHREQKAERKWEKHHGNGNRD